MPLAHIITAGAGPGTIAWLPAGVAMASIVAFAFGPRRLRRAAAALAAAGLACVLVLDILAPSAPSPPGYTLVLLPADGSRVTSPFAVVACGRAADRSSVGVPGADRVLSVSIDGTEVVSTAASEALITASSGAHRLRVEVLTRDHVEYQPPVVAEAGIIVTGPAPVGAAPPCS